MSLLKKWLGCVLSFVLGVCGLSLSACSGMIVERSIDASALGAVGASITSKSSETTKAYKVITDSDLFKSAKDMDLTAEFVWMKVFAVITLVLSILLIVYSVVLLLKNLNIIKTKSKIFDIITISLIVLTLVSVVGLMITSNIYAEAVEDKVTSIIKAMLPVAYISKIKYNASVNIGLYQPIMLTVSIVVTLLVLANQFFNKKKV